MNRDPFVHLGIERVDVDRALAESHVVAFVKAFVRADSRERAAVIWKREGFSNAFARCVMDRMDSTLCRFDEQHSRPSEWPEPFCRQGILIDGKEAFALRLEQASALSIERRRNALFSIESGRLAVLFHHEWGVWFCLARGGSPAGR